MTTRRVIRVITFTEDVEETKPFVDFRKDGDPLTDISWGQRYETLAISGQTVGCQEILQMLDGARSELSQS